MVQYVENRLPRYFELMQNAQDAAQAVDDYDLNSSDPQNVAKFNDLKNAETLASLRLIEYVHEHFYELKTQMLDMDP